MKQPYLGIVRVAGMAVVAVILYAVAIGALYALARASYGTMVIGGLVVAIVVCAPPLVAYAVFSFVPGGIRRSGGLKQMPAWERTQMVAGPVGFVAVVGLALWLTYPPDRVNDAARRATWEAYIAAGQRAFHRADYAEAETRFEAALNEAAGIGADDPRFATSLNELALLYQAQARYRNAEPLYRRALEIREKVLGPEHPHVG